MSQFVNFVHNFVYIDAVGIGFLFVVTIPAGVEENLVFFAFAWVCGKKIFVEPNVRIDTKENSNLHNMLLHS